MPPSQLCRLLHVQSLCLLLFLVLSCLCFVWWHASDSLFLTPRSREATSAQPAQAFGSPGTCFDDAGALFQSPQWQWSDREQPPYLHFLRHVKRVQVTLLLFHQASSGKTTHFLFPFSPFLDLPVCYGGTRLGEAFAPSNRHKARRNLCASLLFSRGWLRNRRPCVELQWIRVYKGRSTWTQYRS